MKLTLHTRLKYFKHCQPQSLRDTTDKEDQHAESAHACLDLCLMHKANIARAQINSCCKTEA